MVDDVESFVSAAEILKERGAYKIYVMATHGILSADAPRLIEDSHIDEVWLLSQHLNFFSPYRKTLNLSRGINKGYSLKLRLLGPQNRGCGLN